MHVFAIVPFLVASALALAGEDLQKVYPATMSSSGSGLFHVCGAEDVWELESFEVSFGKDFELSCKKATVALGRHETNVLWAAVFPEKPATIGTVQVGDGEKTEAIFLRFAPSELGRIFPAKTVARRGSAWRRAEAVRISRHKIGWKWSTPAGNPTIVPAGICLVDVDTAQGKRRFYAIDRNGGTLEYVAEFEDKPVPPSPPIKAKDAAAAFDEVWKAFDVEYAGFVLLPEVNWKKLGKRYKKLAADADTQYALAAVISDMLAHLEDLHVWVKAGEEWVPGYTRDRPLNGNWRATQALAGARQKGGDNLMWGRTDDGIGYLGIHGLNDQKLGEQVDAALERLGDTWALVVDLRFNGGGDELLARQVAGRFLDEERVYSLNQYRSGSKHDSLGPKLERKCAPRGPWRYGAPVLLLQGQRTMSSAESMALMFAQCPQVTTMGDRTAGSSANPRRLELDCGITVNLPRWLDMDPEGNPVEHVGIAPAVVIEAAASAFDSEHDAVLEAALKRLRKISKSERKPARE
ncbi:MAG: hypothetical protein GY711_06350 [bacterium]|nr:hypothetical protein [bacterium]